MTYLKDDKHKSKAGTSPRGSYPHCGHDAASEINALAEPERLSGRGHSRRRPSCAKQDESEGSVFTEHCGEGAYEPAPARQKKAKKKKKKKKSFSLPSLPKIKFPGNLAALISRISQLVCCLLMAKAAWLPLAPLLNGREGLGSVRVLITERNYSLACYLALAGAYLAFTALSALWILTKRHFASGDRVVSADMGRGITAFLLLALAFWSAPLIQQALAGQPLLPGAGRFLEIMVSLSEPLLKTCVLGLLLSLLRKILKK